MKQKSQIRIEFFLEQEWNLFNSRLSKIVCHEYQKTNCFIYSSIQIIRYNHDDTMEDDILKTWLERYSRVIRW